MKPIRYRGSLTPGETIMEAAGMIEYQEVQVLNTNNGERLTTCLVKGKRDSGPVA